MSDTSNPPSIRDIAEIAGVSVATVSRVLNKKGKYSATTEKRVLAVVNSCGYISNMSAKSLREARSHTVGLIVPNVTNAFFSQLAYSIETELFQRNYSVFICNSGTDADKERDYFRTLIGKCVDGILCISDLNEIPSDILDRGVPIVCIDRRPVVDRVVPWVGNDDRAAAFNATEPTCAFCPESRCTPSHWGRLCAATRPTRPCRWSPAEHICIWGRTPRHRRKLQCAVHWPCSAPPARPT